MVRVPSPVPSRGAQSPQALPSDRSLHPGLELGGIASSRWPSASHTRAATLWCSGATVADSGDKGAGRGLPGAAGLGVLVWVQGLLNAARPEVWGGGTGWRKMPGGLGVSVRKLGCRGEGAGSGAAWRVLAEKPRPAWLG